MEMLIVVAIIAILLAIAFPTFNKQLNNARVATDAANIRSGYAVATTKVLEGGEKPLGEGVYLQKDGNVGAEDTAYLCQGNAVYDESKNKDIIDSLGSCNLQTKEWTKGQKILYKYNTDEGKIPANIK